MKTISIQDLKKRLSALIDEAAGGETLVITRHRRAIAHITPANGKHLTVGVRAGKDELRPLLSNGSNGRYLEVLEEDRRGGRDR